ncbi:MFS transporter [Streptomyces sp. NPDC059875]|uniref:MFS transporter n=1 Tax=unclassified Streptomyces TaxID=2593676 RepID=UPI003661BA97
MLKPGSSNPQEPLAAAADGQAAGEAKLSRRLMFSIGGSQFGISIVYGAVPGVLLALQIEDLAGDDKAAVLSLFTLAGAIAALVAQPLAGALSDRTRTRAGSRTPYVLGGSLLAAPVLWAMGWTQSLVVLGILYVTSELFLSAAQGPLAAVLPDRVPAERRGRFSAALGLGILLGSAGGTALGSAASANLPIAYIVVGCIPAALTATRLFVAPDPDNSSAAHALPGRSGAGWWKTFLVSPRAHPDFWWALGSRTLTYTGFFTVHAYSLYLLDDYIGLGDDAINMMPVVAGLTALCICISTVPAGIVSDRVGRRKIFICSASAAMAGGLLIPLASPTVAGYVTMTVVVALAFGCFESVDNALLTQVLPRSSSYAQDIGVLNLASIAPQILAPALAGAIVMGTDSYALLFPLGAAFTLFGGLSVLRVRGVR